MSMKDLIYVAVFAAGAAIGSAVTWKYVKDKYERIMQEDFEQRRYDGNKNDSKESYDIPKNEPTEENTEEVERKEGLGISLSDYNSLASNYKGDNPQKTNYTAYTRKEKQYPYLAEKDKQRLEANNVDIESIESILPDEYGEYMSYEQITLVLYADGVMADEDDNIITDPEELLGDDYEDHFGENDDPDTCYFRNHKIKAEYEVIKDERTFKEVIG